MMFINRLFSEGMIIPLGDKIIAEAILVNFVALFGPIWLVQLI